MFSPQSETITVDTCITVREIHSQDEFSLTILSDNHGEDPDCVGVNTPIAQALMGKKLGDVVSWWTPQGTRDFQIIAAHDNVS